MICYSQRSSDREGIACKIRDRDRTAGVRLSNDPHVDSSLQSRTERLKIDQTLHSFEVVALGRQLPQPLIDIEKPRRSSSHVRTPFLTQPIESFTPRFG